MEVENDFASTSSSSPDPLGQPDLSTPLRTPLSRASGSRRKSRTNTQEPPRTPTPASRSRSRSASRKLEPPAATLKAMFAQRRSPRKSALAPREEQEEEVEIEEDVMVDITAGAMSDSPGSPNQSFLGEPKTTTVPIKTGEETPRRGGRRPGTPRRESVRRNGTRTAIDDRTSDSPSSPNQSFLGEPTTTVVPLKTGEDSPSGGTRRQGTPRRKPTPRPRRIADMYEGEVTANGLDEDDVQISPTPDRPQAQARRSPEMQSVGDALFGPPLNSRTRLSPGPTIPAPGASPGKRRRVVSDSSDKFTYSVVKHNDHASPRKAQIPSTAKTLLTSSPAKRRSPRNMTSPRLTAASLMASAAPLRSSANASHLSQAANGTLDPTDEHDEFDSILESEDFTRVSLSNVPSGQYLRSLMGNSAEGSALANGTTTGERMYDDDPEPSANDLMANPYSQSAVETPTRPSPKKSGYLDGFGSGTRRGMREALRLGDQLAKSKVEAKRAATTADATIDVWDELADEESSGTSTSADPLASNVFSVAKRSTASAYPPDATGGVNYPQLPQQQPTPEESDELEQNGDPADQMSWRYDTPAKARLGLPQSTPRSNRSQRMGEESLPPVPPWSEATSRNDGPEANGEQLACAPSSPDKQLFLEQAAYELDTANARERQEARSDGSEGNEEMEEDEDEDADEDEEAEEVNEDENEDKYNDGNADDPIVIDSGDVGSDISSDSDEDEEPPRLSDATQSILQDETDIWADEARDSLNESGLEPPLPVLPQSKSKTANTIQQTPSSPSQIISPLSMRGALPIPTAPISTVEVSSPVRPDPVVPKKAPTTGPADLFPPRRGKLLSMWRRQEGSSPIVYSDELEIPSPENVRELQGDHGPSRVDLKRKLITPPDARKRAKYNDADFSVLSEFKDVVGNTRTSPRADGPPSSPTKRVRFESEDPDNPYYPTTPVRPSVEAINEDAEEEDDEGDEEDEDEETEEEGAPSTLEESSQVESSPPQIRARPLRSSLKSSPIRWDSKPPPRQQGTWLTGWLPSWFTRPLTPLFTFSFPRFASAPLPLQSYEPVSSTGNWDVSDLQSLAKLYDRAKKNPLPEPESADIIALLGKEISSLGWKKRVNNWELTVVEEFLQDLKNDERFTPEEVVLRLFALWATDVQEGRTGLGNGRPGLFCSAFLKDREGEEVRKEVLARARRMTCLAAC